VAKPVAGFVGLLHSELPKQPQWKITPDAQLVSQSRQVLLQQIGRRNAESTLYENMLKSVRRNFADVSLEDMTSGTDARRLFTTEEVVPGMFTRQAWEGGIQQAIEKAANSRRDEIDWVLSDSRKPGRPVAGSPESTSDATLLHRLCRQLAELPQQPALESGKQYC
jgi:type VI protein secretion system component VasK